MQREYDVVIVGGGLAGNCLALALKDAGLRLAIVESVTREKRRTAPIGDRALALAYGTVRMLDALGAWQGVVRAATPIKDIHVSDRGHFGKARLSAAREGVDALGWVITGRDLEEHVADLVEQAGVEQICPATVVGLISGEERSCIAVRHQNETVNLTASLVVGADGGQSSVRRLLEIPQRITEYGQTAIVTTVRPAVHHRYTAFERFTPSGPLALLPAGEGHCSVVWTRRHDEARDLLDMDDAAFIRELQECFGYRLGELTLSAPRVGFPLNLIRAEKMVEGRAVLVGNAVHQLHPVAGQGFNLGLRDVAQLAEMIIERREAGQDIGSAELLNTFAEHRLRDHSKVIRFTNSVVHLFSNDWLPVAAARNAGLVLLDHLPGVKSLLARNAMGLAERLPRIGVRRRI
ncbi:MAG: 2-octaprenyl-6-methoxyphenyl hydroxylase [Gammaproteobacteria bacterium]